MQNYVIKTMMIQEIITPDIIICTRKGPSGPQIETFMPKMVKTRSLKHSLLQSHKRIFQAISRD